MVEETDIFGTAFQQAMDIWIKPEIEERKAKGRLSQDFILSRAQIIFSGDRRHIKVRLNEEVKAKALVKVKVNKQKRKGAMVSEEDIDEIEEIKLTEKDPNCAHITLIKFKNSWIGWFDAIYNKGEAKKHIEAAREFLESARDNLGKERLRPFFENSFACAELAAKSVLLTLPDEEILKGKSHDLRLQRFQNWADLGNVPQDFSATLKRLNGLRGSARYLCSTEFKSEDTKNVLQTLESMITYAESYVG